MIRQPEKTPVIFSRLAVFAAAIIIIPFSATAQTFTQQVQQKRAGEGIVTIHHDADIDRLVNGVSTAKSAISSPNATSKASTSVPVPNASSAPAAKKETAKATPKAEKPKPEPTKAKPKEEAPKSKTKAETSKSKPQDDTTKTKPQDDTTRHQKSTPDSGVPDASPEGSSRTDGDTTTVMPSTRHGYKTTGYRVQAFAGGNTRKDRQKAERTGNAMRQLFPGEDVYVRFYSPRWVCRVGNYRTYEEAHEKMVTIRKMGYETATIVKGKIIVYNP